MANAAELTGSKLSLLNGASNTNLAQGTVGLFVEEFNLICSRAGLFVRKTPRHLREKCHGDKSFFNQPRS